MESALTPGAITAIADLLAPPDEDSDSDLDQPTSSISQLNPGNIGPEKKKATEETTETKAKKNSKDIWDEEEVTEGSEFQSAYDPRPQPEYDIVFKQAITTEDMFLQMGNKTPSSASCEDMVVKITLPATKLEDVTLDVKSKFLDCRTPKYYLGLHLPHPVDHKSGKAQWDGKTETLSVTLRMKRDYDMFNF